MNPTTIATSHSTRFATLRRRMGGIALGLAIGVAALAPVQATVAAWPGVFLFVECIPTSQTIVQDIEAYRSFANEYVVLQGAIVNRANGAAFYSQWVTGTGATAHGAVQWSRVPRGNYNVFYRWASWNASTARYAYSRWIQVTGSGLNTYGAESSPGSGVYIGGATGRCTI